MFTFSRKTTGYEEPNLNSDEIAFSGRAAISFFEMTHLCDELTLSGRCNEQNCSLTLCNLTFHNLSHYKT